MKKIILIVLILNCFKTINAQQKEGEVNELETLEQKGSLSSRSSSSSVESGFADVVLPVNSPFQLGKDVEGAIHNSINKSSGKVMFSLPIASVTANTVGYSVSLSYNGSSAFEMAKKTNKFSPTGILGVGFSYSVPKIIADYKNTAVKDDDTYYLADGNNSKLICTKKTATYLEFQSEKYAPWKIKYIKGHITWNNSDPLLNTSGAFVVDDYWEIIKEDGTTYVFGRSGNSKDADFPKSYVSTWGNWIGDSNQRPTGTITSEWYLYQIKDQWANTVTFSYERIQGKQNSTQSQNYHTEAIYLKQIASSNNSKVVFNYGNKIPQEYFEPHTEQPEPDAYQEKYEKKYLQNIQTFNAKNELIFKYKLEYDLVNHADPTKLYRGKRYLRRIIQENNKGESLPAQEFQYHVSGEFNGGLHKIIYPTGGSVTYNYKKKTLFNNSANRFSGNQPDVSGYYLKASYNAGNYVLDLYRSKEPVSGVLYKYKIVRYHWTGENWTINEFNLPPLLPNRSSVEQGNGVRYRYLDGLKVLHGNGYYGFLYFNRARNDANVYLFHLNSDGKTWNYRTNAIPSVESKNEQPYSEDPVFLQGDDFVAIGTKRTGELRIYTWNGVDNWNTKQINQGYGEYYYAVKNNFILALNEDGSKDLSDNIFYDDNYYMHYFDNEKKWHTKSWTKTAKHHLNSIERASYFYPSNAMAGFMAHDNSESFLRWNTNYDLVNVDKVLGGHNDNIPLQNISSGFYSLGYSLIPDSPLIKGARFNGVNWNVFDYGYYQGKRKNALAYNKDLIFFEEFDNSNYSATSLFYNPNNNTWVENNFINSSPFPNYFYLKTQLFSDFLLINNTLYKKNENPFNLVNGPFSFLETVPFNVKSCSTNGLNYCYATSIDGYEASNPNSINSDINTRLYYTNKSNDRLSYINFEGKFGMRGIKMFGGYSQFLNGNSIYLRDKGDINNVFTPYLYKVIDGNVNQNIADIVIDNIQIDNKLNAIRKIKYEFDQYTFLPNESVYYGKTTTEHKGYGNANNGKTVDYFNTGISNIRFLGTLTKTEIRDANNLLKSEIIYNTNIFTKRYKNSFNTNVGEGYFVRTTEKTESIMQDNGTLTSTEIYNYNNIGLLNKKKVIYSNNESAVETTTTYANELFPFLNTKNILNQPSKLVQKKGADIIGTSETKWKEENYKAFPYQTLAGISKTKVLTEITKVNNFGLAEEESNGKGIFNTNLLGYNNKYQIARISNANFNDVISNLDVSYLTLQTLSTTSLKAELLKLYTKLPKASITLYFYDNNGNLISNIDARKEEIYYEYDDFNRLIITKDSQGNKLNQKEYGFKQ